MSYSKKIQEEQEVSRKLRELLLNDWTMAAIREIEAGLWSNLY